MIRSSVSSLKFTLPAVKFHVSGTLCGRPDCHTCFTHEEQRQQAGTTWPSTPKRRLYDQRGAETEFRSDESGGAHLDKRPKQQCAAQEVWVHLTDMAHNGLSWFQHQILTDSPLASFGHLRISRDLLHMPGCIEMHNGQLLSVKFAKTVPHATTLLDCVRRFWE